MQGWTACWRGRGLPSRVAQGLLGGTPPCLGWGLPRGLALVEAAASASGSYSVRLGSLSAAYGIGWGLPSWLALVWAAASATGPPTFPSRGGTAPIFGGRRSALVLFVLDTVVFFCLYELHKWACMSLLKCALCHASLRVGCAFRGGSAMSVTSCQHAAVEQSRATTTQV